MTYIIENKIDILCVQETWLRKTDGAIIKEIKEYGYKIFTVRKRRNIDLGGGVAMIFPKNLKIVSMKSENYKSFEHMICKIMTSNGYILLINIYRPEYSEKNRYTVKDFLTECSILLERFAVNASPIVIVGDFNFHVELASCDSSPLSSSKKIKQRDAISFLKLIEHFDYSQSVNIATHVSGGTLDLLLSSKSSVDLIKTYHVGFKDEVCSTDHFPIHFNLDTTPILENKKHVYMHRDLKNLENPVVVDVLKSMNLPQKIKNTNVNEAVIEYNNNLKHLSESYFPMKLKTVKSRQKQKWFNDELAELKRIRRRSERKFRKYPTDEFYNEMINIRDFFDASVNAARRSYYTNLIRKNKDNLKFIYKTINSLIDENDQKVLPTTSNHAKLADEMAEFFRKKVSDIRSSFASNPSVQLSTMDHTYLSNDAYFSNFNAITSDELLKIIKDLNNKESFSDPIPLPFLKGNLEYFLPILLDIVNKSLVTGTFPDDIKHAVVTPILKDRDADSELFKNYRPVSTLPYLSKIIEKAALLQLNEYLSQNNHIPTYQSAYMKNHSCETALCKVANDMQKMIHDRKVVALVQLDLSSTFDTVDHTLLIQLLKNKFGINGSALNFFKTYLSGRTFSVKIKHINGGKVLLIYGVPQGSILGPLLFILYISDIPQIAAKHNISIHSYADDGQLYLGFEPSKDYTISMNRLKACIDDIEHWMKSNFLKLNVDKTSVLFIGRPQDHAIYENMCIKIGIKWYYASPDESIKSLGAYLNGTMSMNTMVSQCTKSCFCNLKKLGRIKYILDINERMLVIKSFILTKLDYCNLLLSNVPRTCIQPLERVLNTGIRYIYNLKKRDHISPYYKSAHILPIPYRIMYKSCVMVYKIINGLAPDYMNDLIIMDSPSSNIYLRSDNDYFKVMQTGYENTLQYAMIKNWNTLPYNLRSSENIYIFKKQLKTYYFNLAFP